MAEIQMRYDDGKTVSEWVRRRDGLWIPYRKMNYLYWFRFLQIAEREPDIKVNWRKYKLWGGQNAVMGMGFDRWWEAHWKECFGIPNKTDKQKFPFTTTRPKTESYRLSWLCYRYKDVPATDKWRIASATNQNRKKGFSSNALDIADAVYRWELAIDHKRKKPRDAVGEAFTYHSLNPKGQTYNAKLGEYLPNDTVAGQKELRDTINRALRRAKRIIKNVSEGQFP